jgi:hypothetical protein
MWSDDGQAGFLIALSFQLRKRSNQPIDIPDDSVEPLSAQDEAVLQSGKDQIVNSINNIKDYAKLMMTLVSGFFAVYFAILKFLGGEMATSLTGSVVKDILAPPLLFIVSIIFFVIAVVPLIGSISLAQTKETEGFRRSGVKTRIVVVYVATALFLVGLGITIHIATQLLLGR